MGREPQSLDRMWMARALEMARAAALEGEVPVGALLVSGDRLVAEAHNRTIGQSDPTAHAECVVLRQAARQASDWRLEHTTLYVTLEPCAMCAGAIVLARVKRLVFGAHDPKSGMAGSLANLVQHPKLNHRVELTTGVLGGVSGDLLRGFFRARR